MTSLHPYPKFIYEEMNRKIALGIVYIFFSRPSINSLCDMIGLEKIEGILTRKDLISNSFQSHFLWIFKIGQSTQ